MDDYRPNPYKVTFKNAVRSKCHDCMGHYQDGRVDCENPACALYSYMPYRKLEPNLEWTAYNANRTGLQIRMAKIHTEEELAVIRARLAKARGTC